MPTPPRPRGRLARLFFSQLGMLCSIIVYFVLFERGGRTIAALTHALWVALGLHTTYLLFARWHGELKQFDIGFWLFLALGLVSAILGIEPLLSLYQHYSPALLFTTFGLVALIPLLLGLEPFTVWFAVRQAPRWQHRTPAFATVSRVLAAFWVLVFFTAAMLCALRPTDPMFTALFPNMLVILVGLPSAQWLPPLWFKMFPPRPPDAAEPLIMGMPFAFDRAAAADARAVIQFRVSGDEPGDYWVRVDSGRCESFEGVAPSADLTVHTPDHVWVGIARGEVDGGQALMERRYSVEGDPMLLAKLRDWFPGGRS
jgi:SCP-2 sterol transfer family